MYLNFAIISEPAASAATGSFYIVESERLISLSDPTDAPIPNNEADLNGANMSLNGANMDLNGANQGKNGANMASKGANMSLNGANSVGNEPMEGVLVAPFSDDEGWGAHLIPGRRRWVSEEQLSEWWEEHREVIAHNLLHNAPSEDDLYSMDASEDEHKALVRDFASHLERLHREGTTGKIVAARCMTVKNTPDIIKLLATLRHHYPNATIFCLSTALCGTWIGATPELLMERNKTTEGTTEGTMNGEVRYSAMALAGTRPSGTSEAWDPKNLEEQRIVTDYLLRSFEACGISATPSPLHTRQAGPVEHLCTIVSSNYEPQGNYELRIMNYDRAEGNYELRIMNYEQSGSNEGEAGGIPTPSVSKGEYDGSNEGEAGSPQREAHEDLYDIVRLLSRFSPTPALGGYPRGMAMEMIRSREKGRRGAYGGYFGYVDAEGAFRMYVNLRSARIFPEAVRFYAGGGITRHSDPDAEWMETIRKMQTLLGIMNYEL